MFFYIFIGCLLFWPGYTTNSKRAYKFALFLLFFITAFRNKYMGGTDAYVYTGFFEKATSITVGMFDKTSSYQIGYSLLNYIVRHFTDNYYFFQIIYAGLTIFLLDKILQRIDLSWAEKSMLIFSYYALRFFYFEWVAFRQNIADLLFWLLLLCFFDAIDNNERGKLKYLLLCIVLPYLFHSSSILCIPFIFAVIVIGRMNVRIVRVVIPIASVLLFIYGARLLGPVSGFLSTYIDEGYAIYGDVTSRSSNLINYVLRFFMYIALCIRYDEEHDRPAFCIFSVMFILSSFNLEIAARLYEYFAIGYYMACGSFMRTFNVKNSGSYILLGLVYFVCMTFILIHTIRSFDTGAFIPFQLLGEARIR